MKTMMNSQRESHTHHIKEITKEKFTLLIIEEYNQINRVPIPKYMLKVIVRSNLISLEITKNKIIDTVLILEILQV